MADYILINRCHYQIILYYIVYLIIGAFLDDHCADGYISPREGRRLWGGMENLTQVVNLPAVNFKSKLLLFIRISISIIIMITIIMIVLILKIAMNQAPTKTDLAMAALAFSGLLPVLIAGIVIIVFIGMFR